MQDGSSTNKRLSGSNKIETCNLQNQSPHKALGLNTSYQPSKDEDSGEQQQQQSHLQMDNLHQMNNNRLLQFNEERLSTPIHVLSSLSTLDISLQVGENFNDPGGTIWDVSNANISKN